MNQYEHADHVRIHVDREPYDLPNPTTGAALYALGGVAEHHDLFREQGGDGEDELIERRAHDVRLKPDEHFYSQKVFTIIVDTEDKEIAKNYLTFDDVVKLAFETPPSEPNILITVDYGMGSRRRTGRGRFARASRSASRIRMVFDVSATDRSVVSDLKRLRDEGYNLQVVERYLVVRDIPYLAAEDEIKRGILICALSLANAVATAPGDHTAHFIGAYPCHADGSQMTEIVDKLGEQRQGQRRVDDELLPLGQAPAERPVRRFLRQGHDLRPPNQRAGAGSR